MKRQKSERLKTEAGRKEGRRDRSAQRRRRSGEPVEVGTPSPVNPTLPRWPLIS